MLRLNANVPERHIGLIRTWCVAHLCIQFSEIDIESLGGGKASLKKHVYQISVKASGKQHVYFLVEQVLESLHDLLVRL